MKKSSSTVGLYEQLAELGYTNSFIFNENFLTCTSTEKKYYAQDLKLTASYRYEGISDPDDARIIYALVASDGSKGTITDAHGLYADPLLTKFLEQVQDVRENSGLMENLPSTKTIQIHVREESIKE